MTATEILVDPALGSLTADVASLPMAPTARIAAVREAGAAALTGARLPTPKDEAWRFTSLAPFKEVAFRHAGPTPPAVMAGDIGRFLLTETTNTRLVFVNGVHVPHLSSVASLPEGVTFCPLALAPLPVLELHLGRHIDLSTDVFAGLNARHLTDGALVHLARNVAMEAPLQVIFVSTAPEIPLAAYPRLLVVLEAGATASLIEEYVCLEEGLSYTNAVSEIVVSENARLQHTRVQSESRRGFHFAHAGVTIARDGCYANQAITLGARLSRFNLDVVQTADNASCFLDGLALLAGQQEADTHTFLDHAKPYGQSEQLHKCVVDDAAHAVFNGRIQVRQHAQLVNSSQSSRNLLLSEKARVDTKPELEIHADDVKCAHGATVGQIDAEELFYLKSRGLDEGNARDLLTYAFAAEVIEKVPVASLCRQLKNVALSQTNKAGIRKGGQA